MKRTASLILTLCLLLGTAATASADFADISDPDVALSAAVLQGMGIVEGIDEEGLIFLPEKPLSRAEFCALAVRSMGLDSQAPAHASKLLFTDAKPGSWYTGYVNLAYSVGAVAGYGNGLFGPDDPITLGQAATLVLRILGYTAAEIGTVWPADYIRFAMDLGVTDGLSIGGDGVVTRGQAALLLCNMLDEPIKGSAIPFYMSYEGVSTAQTAILLDSEGTDGKLSACVISQTGAVIEHFSQKNQLSGVLEGYMGQLLLDNTGKALGFIPDEGGFQNITISSAGASAISSTDGREHRIGSGATVIYNGELMSYGLKGFLEVDAQRGKTARLFYDEYDAVRYIYITSGAVTSNSNVVVASGGNPAVELATELGIVGNHSITKNGASAGSSDLAKYDVAYYDKATRTMRVSDYKLTGFITDASPNLAAAKTVTVSGCTMDVMESAWDSLGGYRLGDEVTLLLTDDNCVAAARSPGLYSDMYGILSTDGKSITLLGSGLKLTAKTINAEVELRGSIVEVIPYTANEIDCYELEYDSAGKLNVSGEKLGSLSLAPAYEIYEWTGSGYVYSLSGAQGIPSRSLDSIDWTGSISSALVSWYRENSAGEVDAILLEDVSGNCYSYGRVRSYYDEEGAVLDATKLEFADAVILENSSGESIKYVCDYARDGYGGISLGAYSATHQQAQFKELIYGGRADEDDFYLEGGDWYVEADGYDIPVSENVQVYFDYADLWKAGEAGLSAAITSRSHIEVYYDRSPNNGGQVRIIEVY